MSIRKNNCFITVNTPEKNLRKKLAKFSVILLFIIIAAISTLYLIFSEERVKDIIENGYTQYTGLELNIDHIDLELLKGRLILHNVTSTTPKGKKIADLSRVSLQLSLNDIYNLYRFNSIHIQHLELSELKLTDIPYKKIIEEIAPEKLNTDITQRIAKFFDKTNFNVSYAYLEQKDQNSIRYQAIGSLEDDNFSGKGKISGLISNLTSFSLKDLTVTAKTSDFKMNFNNSENTFSGNLTYNNFNCDFDGTMVSSKSPLKILNAVPETTYIGSGTWDLIKSRITVRQAEISNNSGLMVKASGYIDNPTKSDDYNIHADVEKSRMQFNKTPFYNNSLALSIPDDFTYTGKVNITDNHFKISGKVKTPRLVIENQGSTKLTFDFSSLITADNNSILFENIESQGDNTALSGSILIPEQLFKSEIKSLLDLYPVELNLVVKSQMQESFSKLQRIGILPYKRFSPHGDISLSIITKPEVNNTFYKLAFGSNDDTALIHDNLLNQDLEFGRFSGSVNGFIHQNKTIIPDKLIFKSNILNLNYQQNNNNSNATIIPVSYDLDGDFNKILSILLPYNNKFTGTFDHFKFNGKANFLPQSLTLTSPDSKAELRFASGTQPANLTLQTKFSLQMKDEWALELDKATLQIQNVDPVNNKAQIGSTSLVNLKANLFRKTPSGNYEFYPHGNASIGTRSQNTMLLSTLLNISDNSELPFTSSDTTLRGKLTFTPEVVSINSAFNIKNLHLTTPVDFSESSLNGNTSLKYLVNDNKLAISDLELYDDQKNYTYTAAGNFYIENAIFEGFNSKLEADIDKFFKHFKGYGNNEKFEGQIEVYNELIGTTNAPSMLLVGKSKQIKITKNDFSDISDDIQFDARLSWSRDTDGSLFGLKAEEIFLKSSNASVYLTGVAEKFKLEKSGIVNFGKGCDLNFMLKGNRKLLQLYLPGYTYKDGEFGTKDSLKVTANIKAKKLPLFSFEDTLHHAYIKQAKISNGTLSIDKINYNNINIFDLSSKFSLNNGIAKIEDGRGRMSGNVFFSAYADVTQTPKGKLSLKLEKIDLPQLLSHFHTENSILNGWLILPANKDKTSTLNLSWEGITRENILASLNSDMEKAEIKDLILETINKRHDWEKYLSEDLPPNVVKEVASQIDKKMAPTYGKKQKAFYRYCDINYKIGKSALQIHQIKCGGGNTADYLIRGIVSFSGKLKLRIYPVANIQKSFDSRQLLNIPSVNNFTTTLTPLERTKFYNIIPNRLEKLANEKKLFIDITGTIENPVVNIDNLRSELRKNVPVITKEFNNLLGNGGLLKLLMKNVQSDKLKNALGINGDNESLKSGSSLGDILKLFE